MSLRGAIGHSEAVRARSGHTRDWLGTVEATSVVSAIVLASVMATALALRLYKLDSGLWLDEIFAYVNYARMPLAEIVTTYDSQNQHFMYSLMARVSFLVFGESAWSLRLPSVFFGVASIGALYLLGRELTSKVEALLAMTLMTFSYHHIWFSQNARGYAGLLFWTLAASWLLLRALSRPGPAVWLGFAVAAALGMYTNTAMVFVICGHMAVYLMAAWRGIPFGVHLKDRWLALNARRSGLFLGFGGAVLLTLLLYAPVMEQVIWSLKGEESTVRAWTHPLWALLEIVRGMGVGFAGGRAVLAGVAVAGAAAVFGAGMLSYRSEALRRGAPPVLISLFTIPVVLCAGVVIGLGHHLWPRLFYFALGFGVLIVIRGCMVVGSAAERWAQAVIHGATKTSPLPLGLVLSLLLIIASALSISSVYLPKQDYEGALRYVDTHRQPGDAVAVVGLATFPLNELLQADWHEVETVDGLQALRTGAERVWLVYTFPPEVAAVYPDIMAIIEEDFATIEQFYGTVGSGTVFVTRADEGSAPF